MTLIISTQTHERQPKRGSVRIRAEGPSPRTILTNQSRGRKPSDTARRRKPDCVTDPGHRASALCSDANQARFRTPIRAEGASPRTTRPAPTRSPRSASVQSTNLDRPLIPDRARTSPTVSPARVTGLAPCALTQTPTRLRAAQPDRGSRHQSEPRAQAPGHPSSHTPRGFSDPCHRACALCSVSPSRPNLRDSTLPRSQRRKKSPASVLLRHPPGMVDQHPGAMPRQMAASSNSAALISYLIVKLPLARVVSLRPVTPVNWYMISLAPRPSVPSEMNR